MATAAGLATLHAIESRAAAGRTCGARRRRPRERWPATRLVTEVRGEGLLIGFDLAADGRRRRGAPRWTPASSSTPRVRATLRLAPPLILTAEQAARFIAALPDILPPPPRRQSDHPQAPPHDPPLPRGHRPQPGRAGRSAGPGRGDEGRPLRGSPADVAGPQTVAVIFDKTSTRTRVSFAAGIAELGGVPADHRPGGIASWAARSPIADTARVLEPAGRRDRLADVRPVRAGGDGGRSPGAGRSTR